MAYSNKFVMTILVNNQIIPEKRNGEVHIEFSSEYVVRVRNKNDRRAVVELVIDGEIVGNFVVNANSHLDIKRWAEKDVAFKFVDLESPEAYDHGKQGANPDKLKGTVEARFKLEKAKPVPAKVEHHYHTVYPPVMPILPYPMPRPTPWYHYISYPSTINCSNSAVRSGGATSLSTNSTVMSSCGTASSSFSGDAKSLGINPSTVSAPPTPLLEGCTVEGNRTGQQWVTIDVDTEDDATVLQLFLKGYAPYNAFGGHNLPPKTSPQAHPHEPTQPLQEEPGVYNTGASLGFCPQCGKARQDKMDQFCSSCGKKF